MFHIRVEGQFSAAHQINGPSGPSGKLHGHNYRILVHLAGETLNDLGILIDYAEVKDALTRIIEQLDHEYLNDLKPFAAIQPTCEVIARLVYRRLQKELFGEAATQARVCLREVLVQENDKQSAAYSE